MARKLAKPGMKTETMKTGITTKTEVTDDLTRKREDARKMAKDKARARTLPGSRPFLKNWQQQFRR